LTDEESKDELLFKQYELMVNSTLQVTAWRQTSNGFYITLNTAILAILSGIFETQDVAYLLLGVAGIAISTFWYMHIDYFAKLNGAKFDVIWKMEERFPIKAYVEEYEYFKAKKCKSATQIEKGLVCVFVIIYIIILVTSILNILTS